MRTGFIHIRKDGDHYAILGDGVDVRVSREQLEGLVGAGEAVLQGVAESEARRYVEHTAIQALRPFGDVTEISFVFEAVAAMEGPMTIQCRPDFAPDDEAHFIPLRLDVEDANSRHFRIESLTWNNRVILLERVPASWFSVERPIEERNLGIREIFGGFSGRPRLILSTPGVPTVPTRLMARLVCACASPLY